MPRFDERFAGLPYRHGWYMANVRFEFHNALAHIDLKTRSRVYRAASNTSELLILNALDIAGEPAAVLKIPRRVPLGTHGCFVPE